MPSLAPGVLSLLVVVLTALVFTGSRASAANLYWDTNGNTAGFGNTTGTWGTSAFWNDNAAGGAPTVALTATTSSSDIINFGSATLKYDNYGILAVAAGGVAADSIVIGGGQTVGFTLGTSGNPITIQNGITKNSGSVGLSVTSPIILGAAQTWTNHTAAGATGLLEVAENVISPNVNFLTNGGYQLTIDGTGNTTIGRTNNDSHISISGSGALVKNGSGYLQLGGNNSAVFSGKVTLNGGVLGFGISPGSLGTGNLEITNGVLEAYWTTGFTRTQGTGANEIQITGGASGFSGGNNPNFNIGSVVWGSATFNPTQFVLNSSATGATSTSTFSNNIDLGGATRTIRSDQSPTSPTSGRGTFSGIISNGGIIKTGVGLHVLSGTNTYNGGTTVEEGTLQLGNNSALGPATATLTVNGGLLNINNFILTVGNLTGTGGKIANNGNAARTLTIGSGNGTGGNFQGVIANNNNAGTGTLALVKTGSGTITLSGNNTYTGTTTISGGILQIGNGGTSGSLANSALTNNTTLVYDRSNDFSVGYTISGIGNLIKQGAGIMTLTTTAAYTGDTTISAGTLKLNQVSASNDGAFVTIAETGATLDLNFTGTDLVEELYIGTTRMAYGVYKAIGNPAPGIEIAQITGTGTLTVSGDVMAPTLFNIVEYKNGRPAPANAPITYTVTFSETMDESTVTAADFTNAGTAPISIGGITQTTPGVFTVLVTPTDAGTLRLKIPAGAELTDPAGNPVNTTSDILDNVTLGIYMPDSTTPTLRGISPVANSSGSTLTLTMPPGVRPGDLLIANIAYYDASAPATAVPTTGTGWTARRNDNLAGSNAYRAVILSRTASAASPGPFVLNLNGTSPVATGVLMAFSGVDTSGLRYTSNVGFEVIWSRYHGPSATSTVGPAPSITTVLPNAAVLMLGASIGTESVAWSNWATATSPGALTELYDVTGSGTGVTAMSLGAALALKPSPGATGAGSALLSASALNSSAMVSLRPSYISSVMTALTELKAHVTGEITLSAAQITAHQTTIVDNRWTIGVSSSALAAALDLVRTYDEVLGPLWVARNLSSRGTDLHYTIFKVMQYIVYFGYTPTNLANHPDLLNNFSFGSSAKFPGACAPPADPEQVHTAVINANYPDSWGRLTFSESNSSNPSPKPTGTYLAPGSIATITVPASMVGKGYNVRVGAHKTDFSDKTSIVRLDECTRSYPINSTSTKVANPLGGGIYIDVPPYITNVGVVSIQIKNAVRSPYFSAKSFHQTTLSEWQNTERNHPAPWADFQSEKVMMQVPTSWIYALNDPVTLMADWDRAADCVNDLMGFPRIRGRESIYNQVDLMIAGIGGFTPGWPSVNNTYSPGANYNNGYADHYLVRGPQYAPYVEFHELGHAYLFPKFPGEVESVVNLLHVPVFNLGFGYSIDEAFRSSISGNSYVTLDTAAIAWMMCDNFGSVMPQVEKQYAFKGHAKFVEVARLFGWDRLGKYYYSMNADYEANKSVVIAEDVDSMLFRLAKNVNSDIRPLFHFWGVLPANSTTLGASIQAANLPASRAIYDTLVHYKSLVPPDNATFRTFAYGWWGNKQPLSTGFTEERNHAARWDSYDAAMATTTAARAQAIIDLYFPAGRPSDYGDWRSQWAASNLLNPLSDLDGDGMSNEHERIWGMDPTVPMFKNPINSNSGLKSGGFNYTRRNRALTGLNYTVWTSPNLNDWTEDTGAQQTPGAPDANGNQTVETVLSPGLLANPSLFIRMRASE